MAEELETQITWAEGKVALDLHIGAPVRVVVAGMFGLLAAFDVTISYDKPNRRLTLTATIGPGLLPPPESNDDRPGERSLMFGIAGAGFEPATFGL